MSKVFTVFKAEKSKRPIDGGAGVALRRARSRSLGLSQRGSPFLPSLGAPFGAQRVTAGAGGGIAVSPTLPPLSGSLEERGRLRTVRRPSAEESGKK